MAVLSEQRARRRRWPTWILTLASSLLLWAFIIWAVWFIAIWVAQWL